MFLGEFQDFLRVLCIYTDDVFAGGRDHVKKSKWEASQGNSMPLTLAIQDPGGCYTVSQEIWRVCGTSSGV